MKRMIAFIFLCLSALVFLLSLAPALRHSVCRLPMEIGGQAGMALSLLAFFILPGKKRSPNGTNNNNESI